MNNKEIINRLEAVAIDVLYKAQNAHDKECREEWEKDLTALQLAVTILERLNK